jgi:hypothetical protein
MTHCSDSKMLCLTTLVLFPALIFLYGEKELSAAEMGNVTFRITEKSGKRIPCRIHLKNAAGLPQRAKNLPFWRDHFVCPGEATLALPTGKYTFEIERGPEYQRQSGVFDLVAADKKTIDIRLNRIANLAAQGWYSGDLHVHRKPEDVPLLMQAEDLHVAPVITWWVNRRGIRNLWKDRELPAETLHKLADKRYYDVMGGEDEREAGALLFFHLRKPLSVTESSAEFPSPMKYVAQARKNEDVWIDIEKPFWWDVPLWLSEGKMDSIGLANNHMCRSSMYESEAWGKPRDINLMPAPRGNGFWTQEIYYHILNTGLRVPPSAGSASGVLPNPVGYNRVYVYLGNEFNEYRQWWDGLKAGRSFVTNGPLLLCRANGQLPGHVFQGNPGDELKIDVKGWFKSNDPVPAIEIIKNDEVAYSISPEKIVEDGRLTTLNFQKSGWFLVRAITDNKRTFRFASTAPFYVEIGSEKRRISQRSVKFFLDWVVERTNRVSMKLEDPQKLQEVLAHHKRAKQFWQDRSTMTNAK